MVSRRRFLISAAAFSSAAAAGMSHAQTGFELPERLQPQFVRVRGDLEPGQLIVQPSAHYLYWITEHRRALRYGVGVGQAGLNFTGSAIVGRKAKWPSWRPTNEMIERAPQTYAQFADGVPGGLNNPLGARALYLYRNGRDTYFRIHGTTEPASIGRSVSNGCIRMLNEHVIDLYERVPVGTTVTVV